MGKVSRNRPKVERNMESISFQQIFLTKDHLYISLKVPKTVKILIAFVTYFLLIVVVVTF